MVGLKSPGDSGVEGSESGGSAGSPESPEGAEVGPVVPASGGEPAGFGGETVEFFEEERPLPEAVSLMAKKLDDPGSFGIVEEADLADLREQIGVLQERADQQEAAISDLAEAVEVLARRVGDGESVLKLNASDFEGIYRVSAGNQT